MSAQSCLGFFLSISKKLVGSPLSRCVLCVLFFFSVSSSFAEEPIGNGDGRIHIIPTLSSTAVENGEKITISALVKAQAGIAKVQADLGGVETVELKPAPMNLGGVNEEETLGLYTAEWTAHDFENEVYSVALAVTDKEGHTYSDRSLAFSDRASPGTALKASPDDAGMARVGGEVLGGAEKSLISGVIDLAGGYAYFGTYTSPGIVVKVALGSGSDLPTRVGAVTLNSGEDVLTNAVIDPPNGYAYFGTYTSPGIVVKVALGSGSNPPTRVGAVTLNSGEGSLSSAVIDPAGGYAYFGTSIVTGIVVKVALGSGSNPPTRVGAVILDSDESFLDSAVIDPDDGYAYFGTQGNFPSIVKVDLGSGSNPPTRVGGAAILNNGEGVLTTAVIDPDNSYAYFGTNTNPGVVVKVSVPPGPSDVGSWGIYR